MIKDPSQVRNNPLTRETKWAKALSISLIMLGVGLLAGFEVINSSSVPSSTQIGKFTMNQYVMKILPAVNPLRNQEHYILTYVPGDPVGFHTFNNTVMNFPNFTFNETNLSYPNQLFCLHLWYNEPRRDKIYDMYIDVPE